jgi:hypothetical protein
VKLVYIIFCTILIFKISIAQSFDTTKVLFIGNSFTSQNNLPSIFQQLAQSANKKVVIASHMPGGISVGDISQGTSAHMNNPLVYSLIKSNDWDYLVLQDNQGRFCLGYGQFPASSLVIEGHLKILDSLLFYHPCAHVLWYAGFGPKYGYPPYGNTGAALIDSIYHNYQYLHEMAGQIIAPIGPAFLRIITGFQSINLWGPDDTHPSLYGSFLIANVLYTTIFKSSPITSSYNPGISLSEDSLLKNIAFQTTIDSLHNTGLLNITPNINQIGNTLSVNGYPNCNWFYNNMPYISNNCSIIINQSGVYSANVSDINGCNLNTLEQTYFLTEVSEISENDNNTIILYPNPAINQNNLNVKNRFNESIEISFYNILGEIVLTKVLNSNQNQVNILNLKNGIYLVTFKSENISRKQKLIIKNN